MSALSKKLYLAVLCTALVAGAGLHSCAADQVLPSLDLTKTGPASRGNDSQRDISVGVAGVIYTGCLRQYYEDTPTWATWKVPKGYTAFEAWCGVDDEKGQSERPATFGVLVNGDLVKSVRLSLGEKAARLSVPVKEGDSLKLTIEGWGGVFAEPRLIKGSPTASGAATTTAPGTSPEVASAAAPFVVDPNDLEKLAAALRKRVDQKPELKQRIAKGQTALMTFTLLDIPSQTVAANVAEDLYTSMINNDFPLVERGQLDKIIKELKIQDTALIDPATAQKIGQLSGCDVILLGSISDRGTFVVINARLMETATGKSLAAERVEMRKIPINRG